MSPVRWGVVAALAAALAWVLVSQPHDDGFRRGHRGWVTAHTLAIAQRASASHGFVGYTLALSTPARRDLYYFDRYPVFFAAGLHAAAQLVAPDKHAQIHVSRQVMNLLYAATIVMGAMLLVELGVTLELSVAGAAMAGAGYTMLHYRDMVHFDQPALLGLVALLWAIAGFHNGRGSARVLVVTALAVMAGRGYASYAALGSWWILDTIRSLGMPRQGTGGLLRTVATSLPTRACVLGIAIGAACLTYNIVVEARVRGVPLAESSIVVSARQRLALDDGFNERTDKRRRWQRFLSSQQTNLVRSTLPWTEKDPLHRHDVAKGFFAASIVAVAFGFAWSRAGSLRVAALVACSAGPLWLVAMRNLAAFHPYTAVYFFPLILLFFAALLQALPRRLGPAAALLACGLLVVCVNASNRHAGRHSRGLRLETTDMETIAHALPARAEVATDGQLFPGVPFALGFYLPDHDIAVEGPASFVLTRRANFRGENLTPHNSGIYLFRPRGRYQARSSLARLHTDTAAAARRERRRRAAQ
ncbi:MAG: hypothetical protein ABR587_00200 [Candidatus Binatia bacterium]